MTFTDRIRSALRRRDHALDYLNEATSMVDLERRQREIDRGRFNRRPTVGGMY